MTDIPVYLDHARPLEERVQDLLSRMTLEEKISQMTSEARAIPRLGIPAYNFWNEALHGVARNGRATVFPQAIGMAATWDAQLIEEVSSAIADEGRAKYHAALKSKGSTAQYQGLTFWSPNINIFRDPRWGRGQETWGEDPYLTGEMGAAFVRGLQGDHPRYLKAAACAKHYAVHSGPEKLRHVFDVHPTRRDLYDTYLPAFQKLVTEAKVEAVMGAYNRVNGAPACASDFLLGQTLRDEWGFMGHVVSDCWALSDIHNHHHYTTDAVETAAVALNAGCDLSCVCTYDRLGEAVERGLISEADIDRSLARTLATRFKLGMFDPADQVPYASTPVSVINSPEHRQLAYTAALKSIVLLKNQDRTLPVQSSVRKILVVGPTAAGLDVLLGNYHGLSETMTTLLEGLTGGAPEGINVEYRPGCLLAHKDFHPDNWSLHSAAAADLTIACMGLSPLLEGEEGESLLTPEAGDRPDAELPAVQVDYIRRLSAAGAKIVLVLTGGSPIALSAVVDYVHAIVMVWYPGQEGGRAVADVIFGRAAPSGKLPLTFPKSTAQLPPFEDYGMIGRTYRYADWEPQYPFGFGLSYTSFEYRRLSLDQSSLAAGEPLLVNVTVTNTGEMEAEEVVQVYLSDLDASVRVPFHKLVAFQLVRLQP
ncbi:MAG: glycoside hydrolase family 3 N-terminal domain-containing protein, partial [Anaerolineaceae bacterium]